MNNFLLSVGWIVVGMALWMAWMPLGIAWVGLSIIVFAIAREIS